MTLPGRPTHVALGELLVDLVSVDASQTVETASLFRKAAGGAPANVCVGLARLGLRAAFIGKVADDAFGRFLRSSLQAEGVDTRGLVIDPHAHTPLAFIGAGDTTERSFVFYHRGMADTTLLEEELDGSLLDTVQVVHFGSVTLTAEPGRSTTLAAVKRARRGGALVSFDPNVRLELWANAAEAAAEIRNAQRLADIVKLSRDEIELLTGFDTPDEAAAALVRSGAALAVVTLGADGARYRTATTAGISPAFAVDCVDATGAGDGFTAGLLFALGSECDPREAMRDPDKLERAIEYANAVGALTTTEYGAIPALPHPAAVARLLAKQPIHSRGERPPAIVRRPATTLDETV